MTDTGGTTSGTDARGQILGAAVQLFARHGFAAVTVRQIATSATVSAPLVLHHFGSKVGLQEAVIDEVRRWFEDMLAMADSARARSAAERGTTLAEISLAFRSADHLPELLLRLIVDDDPQATYLLTRFLDHLERLLQQYVDEGAMVDDPDPRMRAAIMLADDFGTILLRSQLSAILGVDPFVGEGLARYSAAATRLYGALIPQGSWLDDPELFADLSADPSGATDEPGTES